MNKKIISNNESLIFIEARGKTAIIGALDIMPKTSDVVFFRRVNIGSGLVNTVYGGEVGAARAAGDAAAELARKLGGYFALNLIPRPHKRVYSLISQRSGDEKSVNIGGDQLSLGMVETEGFTAMAAAADKGIKSADVDIPGWVTVGSGLCTVFYRGGVAAVHSAVEEGSLAASKIKKVISSYVIANPHPGTEEVAPIGKREEETVFTKNNKRDALGILETRGIAALIEGMDAGLKAATVIVQGWEKIGRGMASLIFRGNIADIRAAMDAALRAAGERGQVAGSYIIARPHEELDRGR